MVQRIKLERRILNANNDQIQYNITIKISGETIQSPHEISNFSDEVLSQDKQNYEKMVEMNTDLNYKKFLIYMCLIYIVGSVLGIIMWYHI